MQCDTDNCGCSEGFEGRKFLTREEKIERLQSYKTWLDSESKGVEEVITNLKKAK